MVAGLVLLIAATVFAEMAVFSTAILAAQVFHGLCDGSIPSKMFWLPWVTIVLGVATAILIMQMLPAN